MIISNVTVDHDNITWMRICIWVLHANKVKRSKTSHCKHHKYMYSFANLNIPFVLVFRMKSTCYTLHEVSDLLVSVYEVPNKKLSKEMNSCLLNTESIWFTELTVTWSYQSERFWFCLKDGGYFRKSVDSKLRVIKHKPPTSKHLTEISKRELDESSLSTITQHPLEILIIPENRFKPDQTSSDKPAG